MTAPGTGNYLSPVNVATILRALALQQGHCITSKRATRTMNACADSAALGLGAGICSASRACASLSVFQLVRFARTGQHPVMPNAFDARR